MKRLDILPTEENITKSFIEDSIGRNVDILSFVNLITCIEGGYSIAIDGAWGSGKTFFVNQVKLVIDANNPTSQLSKTESGKKVAAYWKNICKNSKLHNIDFITSYYDAWSHDDEDDPMLSLIYSLMKCFSYINTDSSRKDWIEIITSLSDLFAGKSVSNLIKALEGKNIFEATEKSIEIRKTIDKFLNSIIRANNSKLIVFIDELDRCSPVFAVKLLERIKHYMQNESVIFVFSVNQNELQKTIRAFYGNDFDACRYLDRFFDARINLPKADTNKFMNSLGMYETHTLREATCFEFIKQTNMSLREMSKYLYATKMAAYAVTDADESERKRISLFSDGYEQLISFSVIVPIAIGLGIINTEDYHNFITGKDERWLERILLSEKIYDWVFRFLTNSKASIINLSDEEKKVKVKELYDAIFVNAHENSKSFQIDIGQVTIDKDTKTRIIEATNYASKYSDFLR